MEALKIVKDEFKNKEAEVWDLRTRLKELGQKGITNYEEQSRAISEELYKAVSQAKINSLKKQQNELAKYAGEFTYSMVNCTCGNSCCHFLKYCCVVNKQ